MHTQTQANTENIYGLIDVEEIALNFKILKFLASAFQTLYNVIHSLECFWGMRREHKAECIRNIFVR